MVSVMMVCVVGCAMNEFGQVIIIRVQGRSSWLSCGVVGIADLN